MIEPKEKNIKIGESAEFMCNSVGVVTWLFNSGPLPPNTHEYRLFKEGKYYLNIEKAQPSNTGFYECQGELKENAFFAAQAYLSVTRECSGQALE